MMNIVLCFTFLLKIDIAWFVDYRKKNLANYRTYVRDPSIRITICPPGKKSTATTLGKSAYGIKGNIGYHTDVKHPKWLLEELKRRLKLFDSTWGSGAVKMFEALDTRDQTLYEATASSFMQYTYPTVMFTTFYTAHSNNLAFPMPVALGGWVHNYERLYSGPG